MSESDALLTYPAPERNKAPILEVLQQWLPAAGRVLEIASGTGQHVIHFARCQPELTWLPSDPEPAHLAAIQARIHAAQLTNVAPPLRLDVLDRPWPVADLDAVVCINMVHIAPWNATLALLGESGRLLPPGGLLYLYGPYRRDGIHTAPSNAEFDADLRRRNAAWGVRNLEDVVQEAARCGLALADVVAMPANNLSVVLQREGAG